MVKNKMPAIIVEGNLISRGLVVRDTRFVRLNAFFIGPESLVAQSKVKTKSGET